MESLNEEQRKAVEAVVLNKKNIFLTGVAGSGKSFTINTMVDELRAKEKKVYITASTGVAATLVNGMTLHSWGGIGLGKSNDVQSLARAVKSKNTTYERYLDTDCLIIDEVSMIDVDYFTKLEEVARIIRKNQMVFGGIQLVLVGDFCQLLPVGNMKTRQLIFNAPIWKEVVDQQFLLEKVYRQSDADFLNMLYEIRVGKVSDDTIKKIRSTANNCLKNADGIKPTKLFVRNMDVDKLNQTELVKLPGQSRIYNAIDEIFSNDTKEIEAVKKNSLYWERLEFKVGAQVILLKNLSTEDGLVNGSRGVIESMEEEYIMVRFLNEQVVAIKEETQEFKNQFDKVIFSRKQFPLKLAWALTTHKSQGMSLDYVEIDLKNAFDYGQVYVALSRAKSLERMKVLNFNKHLVKASQEVLDFYKNIRTQPESKKRKLEQFFKK